MSKEIKRNRVDYLCSFDTTNEDKTFSAHVFLCNGLSLEIMEKIIIEIKNTVFKNAESDNNTYFLIQFYKNNEKTEFNYSTIKDSSISVNSMVEIIRNNWKAISYSYYHTNNPYSMIFKVTDSEVEYETYDNGTLKKADLVEKLELGTDK